MQLRRLGPVGPPSGIQCWTLGTKQVCFVQSIQHCMPEGGSTGRNVAYSNCALKYCSDYSFANTLV